jgi:hypothetical protein
MGNRDGAGYGVGIGGICNVLFGFQDRINTALSVVGTACGDRGFSRGLAGYQNFAAVN